MGIVLIPLILVISIILSLIGDFFVRQYLALGDPWKLTALKSVLLTAPFALIAFAAIPLTMEIDPLDGWMSGWEIVQFALVWSAYSSVFWAVMIVLGANARSKGGDR
jgi:hypothetical protein